MGVLNSTRSFVVYSDGISYLEIAEAYRKGLWHEAINCYWSPLYSWVIAAWTILTQPFGWSEFESLRTLNSTIFLASFAAFLFFTRELSLLLRCPNGFFYRTVTCLTFLWGSIGLIGVWRPLPDLLVTALIYTGAGLLLRLRRTGSLRLAALLGAVLGCGYLAKTAVLGIALLFLAGVGGRRRIPVAGCALAAVAVPWIMAVSLSAHRFTIGDSGWINYAWEVGEVRRSTGWQGGPAGFGTPKHPPRLINTSPEVLEFASPVPGVYPLWRDPSHWYEGLQNKFGLAKQLRAAQKNGVYALVLLLGCPALLVALPVMVGASRRRELFRRVWFLLIPCAAAVAMYVLVFLESRYIAGFLVVLGVSVFGVTLANSDSRATKAIAVFIGAILLALFTVIDLVADTRIRVDPTFRQVMSARSRLAEELREHGIGRGTQVGYIGLAINAYSIRLCGARIICEVPVLALRNSDLPRTVLDGTREIDKFWRSSPARRAEILAAMHGLGAEAVIADLVPEWAPTGGWIELKTRVPKVYRDSRTYLYRFSTPAPQPSPPHPHTHRAY
ncbi:MAG: hypothetical protein ACM336_03560 [Acidobacteriota bacterium]